MKEEHGKYRFDSFCLLEFSTTVTISNIEVCYIYYNSFGKKHMPVVLSIPVGESAVVDL